LNVGEPVLVIVYKLLQKSGHSFISITINKQIAASHMIKNNNLICMYHLLAPWDFFLLVAYPVLLKIKFQCYPLSGSDTEYFLDTSITATYSYIFLSCLRLDVCDARFA
jgi:hypothetical protein